MTNNDRLSPKARQDRLVIKELANETLVYDESNHQAHCLNPTAALVWKFCDGHTSISRMSQLLEKEVNTTVPEQTVWLAIKQLDESHLLETPAAKAGWVPPTSRRQLIRTLGVAAVALPIITSLVVPTAAQAATCVALGQPCVGAGLGNCCAGPGIACGGGPTCHVT